nr:unnamed protein product [Callosobruchus analis]
MVQDIAAVDRYTIEEVAKHNGRIEKTVWIIIKDCVYDVSDFLDKHPGGRNMLEEVAGKDASTEFLEMGHSSDAKAYLKTLKIGEIVEVQYV